MVLVPKSILFQYRIFPVVSFRRVVVACGAFVIAFGFASAMVFILECTPIRVFWVGLGGYLAPEMGGRCIDFIRFLLVNGSINTVTDFALLLLVSGVFARDHRIMLTRGKALTFTLASESK